MAAPPEPGIPRLSWDDVRARRLTRHALAAPSTTSPAEIVAAICGAHAQLMSAAELALGLRGTTLTRADVRAALGQERSLVKTFGPRGTVHLLPGRDLPTWCGALGSLPATSGLPRHARLDRDQLAAVLAALDSELAAGELTAAELDDAVSTACGPWALDLVIPAFSGHWPRWRQALGPAANAGVLCFAAPRGRTVTYTSPRRWLPGFRPAAAEQARTWLLRSYLHAYGPATSAQLAQWLAAPRRWAEDLLAENRDRVEAVALEGEPAWVNRADATAEPADVPAVRLLPYFDPYVVGSHPRELLFPGAMAQRALSGGQAGTFPVLVLDGVVAGVWHHRRTGRRLQVTVEPMRRLSARQHRALTVEVDRVGTVLEAQPSLTIGPVAVGPHA
jgi:Winged helix DNA-binding domain